MTIDPCVYRRILQERILDGAKDSEKKGKNFLSMSYDPSPKKDDECDEEEEEGKNQTHSRCPENGQFPKRAEDIADGDVDNRPENSTGDIGHLEVYSLHVRDACRYRNGVPHGAEKVSEEDALASMLSKEGLSFRDVLPEPGMTLQIGFAMLAAFVAHGITDNGGNACHEHKRPEIIDALRRQPTRKDDDKGTWNEETDEGKGLAEDE